MLKFNFYISILLITVLLAACAPATSQVIENEFILTTAMRDGEFVFLGVNNNIAGLVNPALYAKPGEMVMITLINSGDGEHDLALPKLDVKSSTVNKKGETTTITFHVPAMNLAVQYLDTTHAKLGMRGELIVSDTPVLPTPSPKTEMVNAVKSSGVSVEYTLETGIADGKMVYFGKGGAIDGKINPDLPANSGDSLTINLNSGDGSEHDIFVDGIKAQSDRVSAAKPVVFKFEAGEAGTYAYYCTLPGHRQAGMEGKLIVSGTSTTARTGSAPAVQASAAAAPAMSMPEPAAANAVDITRDPADLPKEIGSRPPTTVKIDLETIEVSGKLADGSTFTYWTFNGLVPGPFLRIRVDDTVEVHLKNNLSSSMNHSVDFHAVTGPGGGAVATQTKAGAESMFTFKALNPGLYVYHCATPMVAMHISNGMYGLILVEPAGGLPSVDREFYVMQGELYTDHPFGTAGDLKVDTQKLLDEKPDYFVFNGASMALTTDAHFLKAKTGETVRIFFGVGGPNFISSFHVIGEIFDRVFDQASLTSSPLTNVQTTIVPPGGAAMVEFQLQVPGRYILVDHALSRLQRGLAGYLMVDGEPNKNVFDGVAVPGSGH